MNAEIVSIPFYSKHPLNEHDVLQNAVVVQKIKAEGSYVVKYDPRYLIIRPEEIEVGPYQRYMGRNIDKYVKLIPSHGINCQQHNFSRFQELEESEGQGMKTKPTSTTTTTTVENMGLELNPSLYYKLSTLIDAEPQQP